MEVAVSWIQSNEAALARELGLSSLVRSLRAHGRGIRVHLYPALQPKIAGVLGVTVAVALLSLVAGHHRGGCEGHWLQATLHLPSRHAAV